MKHILTQLFNYLFPSQTYQGKKITDLKGYQRIIPVAPYLPLYIAACILVLGMVSPTPTRFLLNPYFIVFLGLSVGFTILFILIRIIGKQHRDPSFLYLIANFLAFRGLFTLILYLTIHPIIKNAGLELNAKKEEISQQVQGKLQERRAFLENHSQIMEERIREHQARVSKAFSELNDRMDSRLDRFWQHEKEMRDEFWRIVEKEREKHKEYNEVFMRHINASNEKVKESKRQWCRSHPLSRMCEGLEDDNAKTMANEKEKVPPAEENGICLDLPLFLKYEIKE